MIINNNITALSALNITKATDTMIQKSIQPLATGLRINSSADDASGFAISERMRSQIRAYDMAVRNVQDGMSLLQTAEGSLGDANDMLHRMRELSVQASNDTLTSQDRQHIQKEIDEIREQIQHIADYTNFNGRKLLDGTSGAFWSTSDNSLKIRTNGKVAGYEKANHIEKAESDYRIEIKAEPGTAQIQKSHIMNTASNKKADAIISTAYTEININELESNEKYSYEDGTLTINSNGIYRITGTDNLNGNSIKISDGVEAYVVVGNVNLKTSNGVYIYFADEFEGETVRLASEYTPNTLREISQFYTSEGTFVVNEPQELTITQGNSKTAGIMLYGEDTLYDVAAKLNDAISNELGQGRYTDNTGKFSELTDVYINDGKEYAALVIRSAIPGREGELTFSGSEGVINALGLNTIQKSSEGEYRISIYDMNSGSALMSDTKITGNLIKGALRADIDVEFDSMSGITAVWNVERDNYTLSSEGAYTGDIHLKNSRIIFQAGTNQSENFTVQFGDITSEMLSLDKVNVTTRESAMRSTAILDDAIDMVVRQRTQIVSYSNALEHAVLNLSNSGENLTDAQSRITDADMAKSTMRFIEFQILSKSENAMLAQANQQPEAVYSLLGNEE